jgi:hypothetical protein
MIGSAPGSPEVIHSPKNHCRRSKRMNADEILVVSSKTAQHEYNPNNINNYLPQMYTDMNSSSRLPAVSFQLKPSTNCRHFVEALNLSKG